MREGGGSDAQCRASAQLIGRRKGAPQFGDLKACDEIVCRDEEMLA